MTDNMYTVYTTEQGLNCYKIKSFSENEHLVSYIFDYEHYDNYGDSSYHETETDEKYYKGKLTKSDEFDIKKSDKFIKLQEVLTELENKKSNLQKEINGLQNQVYSINSELREAIKEQEKYEPLQLLYDLIDMKHNFLYASSGYGFRIFNLKNKNEITTEKDYDDEYYSGEDIFNYSSIYYSLNVKIGNYGNGNLFKPYLELKSNSYKTNSADFSNSYTVKMFDSIDEITQYVLKGYENKTYNLDYVEKYFKVTKTPLPEIIVNDLKNRELDRLKYKVEKARIDAETHQKHYDALQQELNSNNLG